MCRQLSFNKMLIVYIFIYFWCS